ncbi:hypothetical protein BKA70DRAFT_1429098 [Coprinopsis sp. MPI-PUGE-AT-0042]|nr:hypothetical protein BKA70DRAFT_1429098 [Coprinopsis sp. MPI-PUGE-AT-0042]
MASGPPLTATEQRYASGAALDEYRCVKTIRDGSPLGPASQSPVASHQFMPPTAPTNGELWLQDLYDKSNSTRRQILELLHEAMLDRGPFTDAAVSVLESHLLQICLGNPTLLSGMVRTPFLENQTPLQWAISVFPKISPQSYGVIRLPAIFEVLCTWSIWRPPYNVSMKDLYDSVADACCTADSNSLYQHFNLVTRPIPDDHSFSCIVTQYKETDFGFRIYGLDSQMAGTRSVDLRLLFQGKILSISLASPDKSWTLSWKVIAERVEEASVAPFHQYKVVEFIVRRSGPAIKEVRLFKLNIKGMAKASPARSISAARLQNSGNDFVQYNGATYGYLRFRKRSTIF